MVDLGGTEKYPTRPSMRAYVYPFGSDRRKGKWNPELEKNIRDVIVNRIGVPCYQPSVDQEEQDEEFLYLTSAAVFVLVACQGDSQGQLVIDSSATSDVGSNKVIVIPAPTSASTLTPIPTLVVTVTEIPVRQPKKDSECRNELKIGARYCDHCGVILADLMYDVLSTWSLILRRRLCYQKSLSDH